MILIYAPVATNNSLWHYCMARVWEDVHVVTCLEELLRAVRSGRVEVVLASSLSGLGRSVSHLVQVLREFVSQRVILLVPNSRIDTSKMSSKAFLGVLDAIEEFKHSAAVEAINAGLAAARARGVRLGRPTKVTAYGDDVARLRARGLTGRAIAKELGIPSSSVFKLIKVARVPLGAASAARHN